MRPLLTALLLLGVGVAPAFGAATTAPSANYDIEVVVFSIQAPQLEGSELWTHADNPIDTTGAILPKELPPSADFSKIITALQADEHYQILLERHWRQEGDTRSNDPPVLLTTGDNELDGTLRFYLSRFLHVEVNLMYEPQAPQEGVDVAPDYVIDEQRRIRANELSYFDHPKFGVLVRVSPVSG